MPFIWDAEKQQFKDADTGETVPPSALRKIAESLSAALLLIFRARAENILKLYAERYETAQGEQIFYENLWNWSFQTRRDIKAAHLAVASIPFGGLNQASAADLTIGEQFAGDQLSFFSVFVTGVYAGSVPLDGRFTARAGMYAEAVYSSFENARRYQQQRAGKNEERRILGASEHCPICLEEAAKGWVAIGSLKPIGDSYCRARCRCHFQFRKQEGGTVAVTSE